MSARQLNIAGNSEHAFGIDIWDSQQDFDIDCYLSEDYTDLSTVPSNPIDEFENHPWDVEAEYRITFAKHGAVYTCTVAGPGQPLSVTSRVTPRGPQEISVWADLATVQFDSIQIIGPE